MPLKPSSFHDQTRAARLPTYSPTYHEKLHGPQASTFFTTLYIPIPGVHSRQLRIPLPIPNRLHHSLVTRFGRRKGRALLTLGTLCVLWFIFALAKRFGTREKQWPRAPFQGDPATLVFGRHELQRIWEWEVSSGHYPSYQPIPEQIGFKYELQNPALPLSTKQPWSHNTRGTGSKRVYLDIQGSPPNVAYPPRPVPGSAADLDVVMEHCDFSKSKYVRDCLEVLRIGGGLDNENSMRRGNTDDWKYIYIEHGDIPANATGHKLNARESPKVASSSDPNEGLSKKSGADWETGIQLQEPISYRQSKSLPQPCDSDHPRIYHMFWTGPFTDKPYMALMSFLFTQNLGLHLPVDQPPTTVCRPQFWLWITPGASGLLPHPNAHEDMFKQLKANPWASPFLHRRFKDVIHFKLWNTTEQLDGVPELRDEWRAYKDTIFNSGGWVIKVPANKKTKESESTEQAESDPDNKARTSTEAAPVKSAVDDRLSVVLSDMARFLLCHRFGGTYLDADTVLLRDWEELWGWKGAFAYRWSRLEKYNTAVLRMHKGSALGAFLFRTALKNGLDFHPMTVSRYTKDAYVEGLLLRLPDALFDSAWLNTEYYQRDRPPQPYLQDFKHFFYTPPTESAAPQALGFEGFFRGAYSYHYHNAHESNPFDPSRNWPDLGPRFIAGERQARAQLKNAWMSEGSDELWEDDITEDRSDLDWATVLKRTFESYMRGDRPNMYGEWIHWG